MRESVCAQSSARLSYRTDDRRMTGGNKGIRFSFYSLRLTAGG